MNTPPPPPAAPRQVLIVASIVSCLVMLDSNIVAVALPTIAHSLAASFSDVQWVITAYILPFAALLMAAGSFADLAGRRRAVLLGQVIFAIASLFCGIASSALMLNLARALQGVGASLLLTAALAVINHGFQGAARARAYAFWGACIGIAITSGPIVGGIISSTLGWHWAFLINLPLCAVLILATLKVIPESRNPEARRVDWAGIVLFTGGLFLLTWAVISGNALGWNSPAILARLLGGLALLVAFALVEHFQSQPMVDPRLLRTRDFAGSAAAMVGYAAAAQVMIFYLPLYLQNTYAFTPAVAGVAMLPFALPMFIVPRLVGQLAHSWSSKGLLGFGLAVTTVANAVLALLAVNQVSYVAMALGMALAGTGAGLLNGETAKAVQSTLPANQSGMASGVSATLRFSALLIGVAALGAVLSAATASAIHGTSTLWGMDPSAAWEAAKQFAAGDTGGALRGVSPNEQPAATAALRAAFASGFSITAWGAAAVGLMTCGLTLSLLGAGATAPGELHVAPGE
ncbi:MFS transporter [Paucibacter sp. R3-3]|uniref:MFS transporter n=1 Tax=Roseateles agri TaxID=3098619 RepID=A0ABU5DG62_9BURK|nr:MFS transporter [Paucibacter sp. R3-3]MDY0745267.1 MFS transporter [Paucibacter sp. R3-3]